MMSLEADLVLEGGGTKGVALVGAVARLQEQYGFRRVAGTSVGALVAAFVAAGWSGAELKEELLDLPLDQIPEADLVTSVPLLGPLASWSLSKGVYKTDFIRDYTAEKLAERGVVTFGHLRESDAGSSLPHEQQYKLVVTATGLTTGQLLSLPWDYPSLGLDPDQQLVADAVAASLAIPLFFEPRYLEDSEGETHVLVDGGLLSNFPITIFDRTDGAPPRWPTFGVKIIPGLPQGASEVIPWFGKVPHPGLRHAEAIVATAIVGHDQTALGRPCVEDRTFEIDTSDIGLIDFDMADRTKLDAFAEGQTAADEFLDRWNWNAYLTACRPEAQTGREGSGELYQRHDAKWAWRIKASNGQIVATDGGQGYEAKADALSTLENVISGHYHGLIKELD
jgi:NTE family protein